MLGIVMRMEKENTNTTVRRANHSARREDRTEIPTQLKERMMQDAGAAFDDVPGYYNSDMPARLDALAYTQEKQVEVGPGQEHHLPHELGNLVQQKLGTVRANAMYSSGVTRSMDVGRDHHANESSVGKRAAIIQRMRNNVVQRCGSDRGDGATNVPGPDTKVVSHPEVKASYRVKESELEAYWARYLGDNPTHIHPRTGEYDADRTVSADGTRSIRFGKHEKDSKGTTKYHFHEESWIYDPTKDEMHYYNTLVRIAQEVKK